MSDTAAIFVIILYLLFALVGVAAVVLTYMANWKLFVKAGEPGWKCLIPVYGSMVRWSLAWDVKFFWIVFGVTLGAAVLSWIPILGWILLGAAVIMDAVFGIMLLVKEAQAYGKSGGYIAGYILLNPVFYILLGFSKNTQYVRGMNQGYIANGAYSPDNNGYNYNYNNNNYQG